MESSPKPTKKEMVTAFRTREILAAAREVIERRGLEAVTMEEIALAAGVAKGTIYLYFQGKDDLIQALISRVGEHILADIEAVLAGTGPPPEKLRQVTSVLMGYLGRDRALFPAYARDFLQGGRPVRHNHWQRVQEMEDKFVALLTGLFAEGIAGGHFIAANPQLLAYLLRGMVRSVGYYQMTEGQEGVVEKALPLLLNLLSSGFIMQPETATGVVAI